MKILYVTARWDPKDPDSGSGVNYLAYKTLQSMVDDISICGPFDVQPTMIERGITRISRIFTQKRLIKFYPSYIHYSNREVTRAMTKEQPDAIISKASIPLVRVKLSAPLVYLCDSSVKWIKKEWPHFSKLGFWIMEKWERQVIDKASHIITFSQANADVLQTHYKKPGSQITVHPIPSAVPHELCSFVDKKIFSDQPINLLLVGKTYERKGVDIAIEVTRLFHQRGIPAQLRIVGQQGVDSENISFMGYYNKNDLQQLEQYIENYRWAHFLIFPSRFDAAGIVPSEAAGFGVPTITNATGGIATTVAHGQSGVVLEKHSPPEEYFNAIQHFIDHPLEYQRLRQSTFQRYQSSLNWQVFGERLNTIIQEVVSFGKTETG